MFTDYRCVSDKKVLFDLTINVDNKAICNELTRKIYGLHLHCYFV